MTYFNLDSIKAFLAVCKGFFWDSPKLSLTLFRIMVPIIVAVKILNEFGPIEYLGIVLEPFMKMVGLPGAMGLVWATAMVTNLYAGMAVFFSLSPEFPLSIAQVTVLTSMMLVAHSLPLELRIAQKAGARIRTIGLLRVGGALVLGFCLIRIFSWGGWLQEPNLPSWTPSPKSTSLSGWASAEVKNLMMIFVILFALLALIRVLNRLGITEILTRLLQPLLSLLGIGKAATPVTIIGMTLGIAYGGGLIIQEARAGAIDKKDIFFSLALLGLCHALIEDTLLMMVLGGHILGLLVGRVLFALITVFFVVRIVSRISESAFGRYFFRG